MALSLFLSAKETLAFLPTAPFVARGHSFVFGRPSLFKFSAEVGAGSGVAGTPGKRKFDALVASTVIKKYTTKN